MAEHREIGEMTRPTKAYIEEIRKVLKTPPLDALWESDTVTTLLEEIDALSKNQCNECCYQAESVDCALREWAELRRECATLRHEFKMLQAGATRQRDALRVARDVLRWIWRDGLVAGPVKQDVETALVKIRDGGISVDGLREK